MRKRFVTTNGIRFHLVEDGHPEAPLVLLLHGFPEFWYSWRHQIPVLAEHFRVVAPDLRGYHLSDKPETGYDIPTLSDDVAALIEELGAARAHVVGHDWGGAVAWAFAHRHPRLLDRLAILNGPHPLRYAEVMRANPAQALKSWYILAFQIPGLPEAVIAADDYAFVERTFRHSSVRPGTFSDDDIRAYKQALALPGAVTWPLEYYRANFRRAGQVSDDFPGTVEAPTLIIWGLDDFALEPEQALGLERYVSGPLRVETIAGASHWIQQEAPDEVNRLLVAFLQSA
jgi:pimeloyl-ACP methyl ester carboxylesterase